MAAEDLVIVGPEQLLVPGSDVMMAVLGRLVLILAVLALVAASTIRAVRRRRDPDWRRPPIATASAGLVAVLGLVLTVVYWPPAFFVPEFPALPRLVPADSVFLREATDLPVAADSDRWIASQGGLPLTSGFSGQVVEGVAFGMPFNLVDRDTTMVDVELTQYPEASFPGPYPIAQPTYIEGLPRYHIDQHYLAVDLDRRRGWELIALRNWFGHWQAGSGATWSMDSNDYPDGTSTASGLPILPGTITFPEVESGRIDHLVLGATPISSSTFAWPARGSDGRSSDPAAPPMGSLLRLRADADLSGLAPQAKVIADAARRYGILISDTGPKFGLRGTVDARWDDADLATLSTLTTDDFEFVDLPSVMVSPESLAATPTG